MLAVGAGAFATGVLLRHDANAARRGYSGPGGGYYIMVTDGEDPGTIRAEVMSNMATALAGRLTVYNLSGYTIEVEVIPPESTTVHEQLERGRFVPIPIEHPGQVLWRVWRYGDEPGDYRTIDNT